MEAAPAVETLRVDDTRTIIGGWSAMDGGALGGFSQMLSASTLDATPVHNESDGDATTVLTSTSNARCIVGLGNPTQLDALAQVLRVRTIANARSSVAGRILYLGQSVDGTTVSAPTGQSLPAFYYPIYGAWETGKPDGGAFSPADISNLSLVADAVGAAGATWFISKALAEVEFLPERPVDCAIGQPVGFSRSGTPGAVDSQRRCDGTADSIGTNGEDVVLSGFPVNLAGAATFDRLSLNYTWTSNANGADDTVRVEYSFNGTAWTAIEPAAVPTSGAHPNRVDLLPASCPGGSCDEADLSALRLRLATTRSGAADGVSVGVDCALVEAVPSGASTCTPAASGRAVSYALGEVQPNEATAGAASARLTYFVQPLVNASLGDTGVDTITLQLGTGWSAPALVRVERPWGTVLTPGTDYADQSASTPSTTDLRIQLAARQLSSETVALVFDATPPASGDPGVRFTADVDDSSSGLAAQRAMEGNAFAAPYAGDLNSQYVKTVGAAGAPSRLAFTSPPRQFTAGSCPGSALAISLQLQDATGAAVPAPSGGVAVSATSDSSGGHTWYRDSACAQQAAAGSFSIPAGSSALDLFYSDTRAGAPVIAVSTDAGLAVPPGQQHTVQAAAATVLRFTVQPSRTVVNRAISPAPTLVIEDAFGNTPAPGSQVTLSLRAADGGSRSLAGTTQQPFDGGVAVFANLSAGSPEPGATLAASAPLASAVSAPFDLVPAVSLSLSASTTPPRGALTATGSGGVPPYSFSLAVNGSGGSIGAGSGAYVAGGAGSTSDTVQIRDGLNDTATAIVSVGPGVSIAPLNPAVALGGGVAFTAQGGSGAGFLFALTSSPSGGSITGAGAYTAGLTPNTSDVVQVTDSLGNSAQTTVQVAPTLTLSPSSSAVSSGGTVSFTASGGTGGYSYGFAPGGNRSQATLAGGSYTAGPVGHVTDVVQVTDSSSNTATATVAVANNVPTALLQCPPEVLSGATATLSAGASSDPDGDALAFAFSQVAGAAAALAPSGPGCTLTAPSVATDEDLTLRVVVSDGQGGSAPASCVVRVRAPGSAPRITSLPALQVAAGTAYAYDADGLPTATGPGPLLWSGTIAPAGAPFHVSSATGRIYWLPSVAGTYELELAVSSPFGSDRQRFAVVATSAVPPAISPSANLTAAVATPYQFDADGKIDATGSSPMRFSVVRGPAGLGVDPLTGRVSWIPAAPGNVDVELSAENAVGDAGYAFVIDVRARPTQGPTAVAEAIPAAGPAPLTVALSGARSSPPPLGQLVSYRWELGDGSPPAYSAQPPPHTYAHPGGYSARLTVIDNLGARAEDAASLSVAAGARVPPTARIRASALSGEESLTVELSCDCAQGSAPIQGYLWEYGDDDSSTAEAPTHTYGVAGGYHLRLTVVDANGLTAQDSRTVAVLRQGEAPPFARVFADPPSGPAPLRVLFSAEYGAVGGKIVSAAWTIDGAPRAPSEAQVRTFAEPGPHQACLAVRDDRGLGARDCITVEALSPGGLTVPRILSRPVLRATVGVPWSYDEDGVAVARGSRPLSWSLGAAVAGDSLGAPAGMEVDALTGELSWVPEEVGLFRVILTARNPAGADVQTFDLAVENPAGQAGPRALKAGCGCGGAPSLAPLLCAAAAVLLRRRRRLLAGS